jgi:short-subunit dehydrogenase
MPLYSASKFALEGLSEAVSYELASQDIVVKLIESHGGVTLRTSIRVLDRIL